MSTGDDLDLPRDVIEARGLVAARLDFMRVEALNLATLALTGGPRSRNSPTISEMTKPMDKLRHEALAEVDRLLQVALRNGGARDE